MTVPPLLPSPSEREELADIIGINWRENATGIAEAVLKAGFCKRSSPSSSEAAFDDTRRLNLVADLLDDVRFAHDQYGEPIGVVLVWNAGDGGGDAETTGKDWREAIDKMLIRLYGDVPKTASPSIGCPRCGKQGTSDELMGHTCKASPSSAEPTAVEQSITTRMLAAFRHRQSMPCERCSVDGWATAQLAYCDACLTLALDATLRVRDEPASPSSAGQEVREK